MPTSLSLHRRSYVTPRIARRWSPVRVAFVFTLIGCDEGTGPKPDVTWEGIVSSSATGAPISGATVEVGDGSGLVLAVARSGTTDAQGHYSLTNQGCFPNPYLQASANGYFLNSKPIGCRAGTQTVHIALNPMP